MSAVAGCSGLQTDRQKDKFAFNVNKYCEDHPECYEYLWEIERGFKRDCEDFLVEFGKHQNITFRKFVEHWKKSEFDSIFKDEDFVVAEFPSCANTLFFIIRTFLKFSESIYIQVGALYLLYAIYNIQYERYKVKIRLTHSEYLNICQLLERSKLIGQPDVEFIFLKLLTIDQAFEFSATDQYMGLDHKYQKQQTQLENDILQDPGLEIFNPLKELEMELTEENNYGLHDLEHISKEYDNLLKEVEGKIGKKIRVKTQSDFCDDLKDRLKKFKTMEDEINDDSEDED